MNITDLKTKGFVAVPYSSNYQVAIERAEKSWKDFCKLPLSEKQEFLYSNAGAGVGYEVKDGSGPAGDIKENFDIALSGMTYLECILKRSTRHNPVKRRFIEDSRYLVEKTISHVEDFAREIEKTFSLTGFAKEIADGYEQFFIRFIHYPPQKRAGEMIAQAHPDQSGITFHLFESAPGLECLTYGNNWVPMPVSREANVVIPGMQLQLRSRGELRALWHRVRATGKTARVGRYSAVSFIQFQATPKYDKAGHGRLQEKPEGFNYKMSHVKFKKLFK